MAARAAAAASCGGLASSSSSSSPSASASTPLPRAPRRSALAPRALAMPSSISSRGGGSPVAREAQAASAFASKASKGVSTVVANATAAAEASVAGAATAGAFPRGGHWEVHKFGGTCVSSADRIASAAELMVSQLARREKDQGPAASAAVVVSAMGAHPSSPVKVTDLLLAVVAKAASRDARGFSDDLAALRAKHAETADELLLGSEGGSSGRAERDAFVASVDADIEDLRAVLQAISIAGGSGPSTSGSAFADYVVGHGELWSARLLAAALRARCGADAGVLDAREVLVVTPTPDGTSVDVEYGPSKAALDAWGAKEAAARRQGAGAGAGQSQPRSRLPRLVVVTGFVARTADGQPTTLRRNGSDYSATIVGALLKASSIVIWTDVDGVFSADPRKVAEAVCLESLSYAEAWELAYFGASVLHPRTTQPAMRDGIPVSIRNFFDLSAPGTVIRADPLDLGAAGGGGGGDASASAAASAAAAAAKKAAAGGNKKGKKRSTAAGGDGMVKGFATIDDVALINVEGTGMVGVPGVASAIFTTVRDAACNVVMISQASSEHSICFAVKGDEADRAVGALRARFADAIAAGRISAVEVIRDCAVLAAVGRGMCERKGVAATMFSALAKANVNIRSIAQGCSEYNITVLVDQKDSVRALRAVHGRFYLATLPLAVAVVGPGLIGRTFLAQLAEQAAALREEFDIDVRVLGVASSTRMALSDTGLDPGADWAALLARPEASVPADLTLLGRHLASNYVPNCVIVDATASASPPAHYLEWMKAGIHVITPNKKLNSGPLEQYSALRQFQRESYIHYLYEATVGAGLPVIATLKHLRDTGDRVLRVEGVFSGTLSYIFNSLSPGRSFAEVVAEAKALGYTEPDPRDDLSGTDVARKVTILSREAGMEIELLDVPVASLVPAALSRGTVDDFMAGLKLDDGGVGAMLAEAAEAGEVLRYVGVVDVENGAGSVELRRYPLSHPFAALAGADNIIAFTTARYRAQPLIVRGPGAGAEVTAGGVFSDLLRLAAYLGAPS